MDFLNWGEIEKSDNIEKVIEKYCDEAEIITTNKKLQYFNIPCAFDVETTSFFEQDNKRAIMYNWALGINGGVVMGRDWESFLSVASVISEKLELSADRRLVVYVHNLAFEFQFMRKLFEWNKIFSIEKRKPLYALTTTGIEFRCSYLLSGSSLALLGSKLLKYPCEKMVGDLDYSLLRHSKTPLTPAEIKYCENDVRVVMAYIQEKIEYDGDITRIPLTKTGYTRRYCKKSCLHDKDKKIRSKKFHDYTNLMGSLTVNPAEYIQLKRAFQGGFTHASAWYSGKVTENVGSFDEGSAYPYVMVAEKFPMSRAEPISIKSQEDFEYNLENYCCLFDVEFINIESDTTIEHPLSSSRCFKTKNMKEDNGRVISADTLHTTITEIDYKILNEFYVWDNMVVYNFKRYRKGYLPTDFIKAILKLYVDKTQLKGVAGKELEYALAKEQLNSAYGMCVTDICKSTVTYLDDEWGETEADLIETLGKYNKSKNRFMFYPWGVWVTAYARYNLFTGIVEFGNDYIYSDTDSVKGKNFKEHLDYITLYNEHCVKNLEKAMKHHNLDNSHFKPKTIEGVEKILGVWEFEGEYEKFKTLGAKRYLYQKDGELNLTVSGINKKVCLPYLLEKYGSNDEVFKAFDDGLHIPVGKAGKNTHTYIDDVCKGVITDYTGVTEEYVEASGVHLMASDYSLSLAGAYADYLLGLQIFEN